MPYLALHPHCIFTALSYKLKCVQFAAAGPAGSHHVDRQRLLLSAGLVHCGAGVSARGRDGCAAQPRQGRISSWCCACTGRRAADAHT
jgi:hypothetical protein